VSGVLLKRKICWVEVVLVVWWLLGLALGQKTFPSLVGKTQAQRVTRPNAPDGRLLRVEIIFFNFKSLFINGLKKIFNKKRKCLYYLT